MSHADQRGSYPVCLASFHGSSLSEWRRTGNCFSFSDEEAEASGGKVSVLVQAVSPEKRYFPAFRVGNGWPEPRHSAVSLIFPVLSLSVFFSILLSCIFLFLSGPYSSVVILACVCVEAGFFLLLLVVCYFWKGL